MMTLLGFHRMQNSRGCGARTRSQKALLWHCCSLNLNHSRFYLGQIKSKEEVPSIVISPVSIGILFHTAVFLKITPCVAHYKYLSF